MEISFDNIISIFSLVIGGSGLGALCTWRYLRQKAKAEAKQAEAEAKEKEAAAKTAEVNMAKEVQDIYQQALKDKDVEVQDKNRIINELREDRDHYRKENNELRKRQDQTDEKVRELAEKVERNGRMVKSMRPFLCGDMMCKKRQLVTMTEEEPRKRKPKTENPPTQ